MESAKRYSKLADKYPTFMELNPLNRTVFRWLKSRQNDDNAEGLWRVHDKLYDLSAFVDRHPGGKDWIRMTKGVDITEPFEANHIFTDRVEKIISTYYVRDAVEKRNVRLTFYENGFYRTLKRHVAKVMHTLDRNPEQETKNIIDGLFIVSMALLIASVRLDSYIVLLLASLTTTWTVISAHSFFHRRDNFRMYYFNLTLCSYREWRISHAMSHHMFPNSLLDLEMMMIEPYLCYIVDKTSKIWIQRYLSFFYSPIIHMMTSFEQLIKRVVFSIQDHQQLFLPDLIPFAVPLMMYSLGGSEVGIGQVVKMWLILICTSNAYFTFAGLNVGHHNPSTVHDGDVLSEDRDWGIYTLDSIIDNADLCKNSFVSLTNFGHHALHHLFPTLDHGMLPQLYPILHETLHEFDVSICQMPSLFHVVGQWRQLARTEPTDYVTRLKQRVSYMKSGLA